MDACELCDQSLNLLITLIHIWQACSCCLFVCVCHSWVLGYLIGSNESVHSQVVLHHLLCRVGWVGQRSALEQSGGASLARLARRTGGLDVPEESIPRLDGERWSRFIRTGVELSPLLDRHLKHAVFVDALIDLKAPYSSHFHIFIFHPTQ